MILMKFKIVKDYQELSRVAAEMMADIVKEKPKALLGLATGSSPVGLYKELIRMNQANEVDFSQVTTVNLDEYLGLPENHEQSYRRFMNENLFDHINVDKNKTYVPNGNPENLDTVGQEYDDLIQSLGQIDIQLLGIGHNGHIAFNEPADELVVGTHVTGLTEDTIDANARFFEKREDVPTQAVTMGLGSIMGAKKIILVASGSGKAEVIKALQDDLITTQIPATLLKLHPDVTIIVDEEAGKYLNK